MTDNQMEQLKWAVSQVRDAIERGYYGDLKLTFQDGRITNLERRETKKPPC